MATSYVQYILEQSGRTPCLQNLCQFLTRPSGIQPCRIATLDFEAGSDKPTRRNIDAAELSDLLKDVRSSDEPVIGRLLIVEDLSKEIIEILGSNLDIDPLFFASQIYGPQVRITSSRVSATILPSKSKTHNYMGLQYQRILVLLDDPGDLRKLSPDCNVPRKITILPNTKGRRIGLAQHCCSVLLTKMKDKTWIGIVLVDKPATEKYLSSETGTELRLRSQPFQGGYEDFLERPSYFDNSVTGPQRHSLFEDLIYYYEKKQPPSLDANDPTLLSLMYHPLKIVAAEWASYVEVIYNSIKHYEYSPGIPMATQSLAKFDSDLLSLQSWARRCMQTLFKLRSVIKFVKYRNPSNDPQDDYNMIVEDYEHITSLVDEFGRRLEAMVPVVTSLVQIADTRRSLTEAANVTRLTNLALLFVPLSFVASLFSMNEGVTSQKLRIYFAVAIPLCVIVIVVARLLPFIELKVESAFGRIRVSRKDSKILVGGSPKRRQKENEA